MAAITAIALSHGFEWLWIWAGLDEVSVIGRQLSLPDLLAYGIAAGAAIFVLKHGQTRQVANEIVEELSKVTWPSREETGNATVVVIVTVLIASAYLGVFDAFWLWLTDLLLGAQPNLAS